MVNGSTPLVSVVTVSYNGRRYLDDCLQSVLDQDFPRDKYEVVVVDNASTDGSPDYVEDHYPEVRVVRLDRNCGPGQAVNRTLPHLRGRYLAYLNQDVVTHRRWLVELLEALQSDPKARMVHSNTIFPWWPEYEGRPREGLVKRAYVCDMTAFGTLDFSMMPVTEKSAPVATFGAYGAGAMVDLRLVDELGYFMDSGFFAYVEEPDLGLRLNLAGYKVLFAPRAVVYHDTEWHWRWNRGTLRRSFLCTRNTFLLFYKISYGREFVALLPRLMLGKLLKAGQDRRNPVARLLLALAGIPLLLVGLGAALVEFPAFHDKHRLALRSRVKERGWLVQQLLDREWQPDPDVWIKAALASRGDQPASTTSGRRHVPTRGE